jgi:hypothetical protein
MHTIYFANEAAQNTWFSSKIYVTFQKNMYSRPTSGSVKVKMNAEQLIGVTYMRFNNAGVDAQHPTGIDTTNRTYKWYYCFVNAIEYVNENTSIIYFEIDVMQTWFIQNGSIPQCYVERQHVTDDTFSAHLEAEPVGSDVYNMKELTASGLGDTFASYNWVMNTSNSFGDTSGVPNGAGKYDGVVAGGSFFTKPDTDLTGGGGSLSDRILQQLGSWDKNAQSANIVDLYMFPTALCSNDSAALSISINLPSDLDGYTPENKKLLTYPYSCLVITNNDNEAGEYRWEYFDTTTLGSSIEFVLEKCMVGGGAVTLFPRIYNGIEDDFKDKVSMNNFPKISFSIDAYQAWIAAGNQTKLSFESSMIEKKGTNARAQINSDTSFQAVHGILNSAQGFGSAAMESSKKKPNEQAVMGGIIQGLHGATTVAQSMVNSSLAKEKLSLEIEEAQKKIDFQFGDARYAPDTMVGKADPNISVGKKLLTYRFFNCHVRPSEAVKIDNFFTVFGYAINDVKAVNLNSRAYWNFVKTKNCEIVGEMPATSRAAIAKIFDGGIFFWKNGDNVGNFNVGGRTAQGAIINR